MDIDVVIENLVELLTNQVNLYSKFYDIFLDPIPKPVEIQQYNDQNQLITITIPNRAMDLSNIETGEGNPEGSKEAYPGTLYVDKNTLKIYIKLTGDDTAGWSELAQETNIGNGAITIKQGGVEKGVITANQTENTVIELEGPYSGDLPIDNTYNPESLNAQSGIAIAGAGFLSDSMSQEQFTQAIINGLGYTPYNAANPEGYINSVPVASTSTSGTIKYDNISLVNNSNEQLEAKGVMEQRVHSLKKLWVGTQAQYDSISSKDSNTIYIIEDTEI